MSEDSSELDRIRQLNDKVDDLLKVADAKNEGLQEFYDKQKALYDALDTEEKVEFMHGVVMGCQYRIARLEKIFAGIEDRFRYVEGAVFSKQDEQIEP